MINNLIKAEMEAKGFEYPKKEMIIMRTQFLRLFTIVSALFFLSSCAVFVGDGGHYHRGYWRRHSSTQQSSPLAMQMTGQNAGEAQVHQVQR